MEPRSGGGRLDLLEERNARTETTETKAAEARPCFFHGECGGMAEVEKQGKAVCRPCAMGIKGTEYPLRAPSREPLYPVPEELAQQLGMHAGKTRRGAQR